MASRTSTKGRKVAPPQASLTASGERIDLSDRNLTQKLQRQRSPWQQMAWNYRELIGELGSGIDYEAGIMSKVAWVVGQVTDADEPVLPGSDDYKLPDRVRKAAQEALDRLPFRNGYAFTGVLSTCLRVSGEAWLHGRTERRGGRDRETWTVLSTDEVQPTANTLGIIDLPGTPPRPIDKGSEVLLRVWKPHPRWKRLADSPLRRMLDTCEDIVLIGRELRAAARSRIAANGILLIPNELEIVRKPDSSEPSDFQTELELMMLAPISNEGDAGAVVPVVAKGPADLLDKVKHLTLAREDSEELIEKLQASLARLREGMDMPPDANQSVKDMNHWSAWSVTTENWKNYLEPHARLVADSVTEAYLRPSLLLPPWSLSEDEADMVQVWYDAGTVTENANRGEDAKAAFDRGEIGGDTLRVALGFDKGDRPNDQEYQRMVTWKAASALTPEVVQQLISEAVGMPVTTVVRGETVRPRAIGTGQGETERGTPTSGGPGTQPTQPVPATPTGMQGAARPQGVLDSVALVDAGPLVEIERALRDRLLVAADDAVRRALEKAGSRVRAKAQRTDLAAQVNGLDATDVCPLVGEARIGELGFSEDGLLAKAFEYLRGRWHDWTLKAVDQVARAVAGMLRVPLADVAVLARSLAARIPAAWKGLESRLRDRALDKLYGRGGDELRGEVPDTLVLPGDIRAALAEIGGVAGGDGAAAGGLALGRDVVGLLDQHAERLGFSWKYGITPRERQFDPHRRLNGTRFANWDDPRLQPSAEDAWIGPHFQPGDHAGCLCDYVPVWAIPDTVGTIMSEIEPETERMAGDRLLAEQDDAAGRRGTWAQRSRDERDRILAVQREWVGMA